MESLSDGTVLQFMAIADTNNDEQVSLDEAAEAISMYLTKPMSDKFPNVELSILTSSDIVSFSAEQAGFLSINEMRALIDSYLDYLSKLIHSPSVMKQYLTMNLNELIGFNEQGPSMPAVAAPMPAVAAPVAAPMPAVAAPVAAPMPAVAAPVAAPMPVERIDININNRGKDVIAGDAGQDTVIRDFINEDDNINNSVVINVLDERVDGNNTSSIYLFNKDDFVRTANTAKVYPCREANNVLNSVIRDIELYAMGTIIDRRINVSTEELNTYFDSSEGSNLFINIIKTDQTYPTVASYDVVNNLTNSWVGDLHCNAGAEPEQIWVITPASTNIDGGRKKSTLKKRKHVVYGSYKNGEDIYKDKKGFYIIRRNLKEQKDVKKHLKSLAATVKRGEKALKNWTRRSRR